MSVSWRPVETRSQTAAAVTSDPGGFNFKEFQSNLVFRWEYQPGSTLFVVWNEGRQGVAPFAGGQDFGLRPQFLCFPNAYGCACHSAIQFSGRSAGPASTRPGPQVT